MIRFHGKPAADPLEEDRRRCDNLWCPVRESPPRLDYVRLHGGTTWIAGTTEARCLDRAGFPGCASCLRCEPGLAHALAKPVLILSRNAQDIPIDLSTRRLILYRHAEREWLAELTQKAAKAITDILNTHGLPAKARDLSRRETMP